MVRNEAKSKEHCILSRNRPKYQKNCTKLLRLPKSSTEFIIRVKN
uniref:Uncharacterized protein n=1 Tax=Lepeophtheirus salmonis TaxID=72036 RepID=A0A0K2VGM9_LEPSM